MKKHIRYAIIHDPLCDVDPRRDWSNVGHMICFHPHYLIGDTHTCKEPSHLFFDFLPDIPLEGLIQIAHTIDCPLDPDPTPDDVRDCIEAHVTYETGFTQKFAEAVIQEYPGVILPIYIYDHSGITINTNGFSCPWDSGQIGWIYVSPDDIASEWGKRENALDLAKACLEGEVATLASVLEGEVYGFVVFYTSDEDFENGTQLSHDDLPDDHEVIESCWGFIGDPVTSGVIDDAQATHKYEEEAHIREEENEALRASFCTAPSGAD